METGWQQVTVVPKEDEMHFSFFMAGTNRELPAYIHDLLYGYTLAVGPRGLALGASKLASTRHLCLALEVIPLALCRLLFQALPAARKG